MTGKELLEKIVQLQKRIVFNREKIVALTEQATNISSQMTGMPNNPSKEKSPMATAVGKKIDFERETAALEAERNEYIDKIDLLENVDHQRILTLRYVREKQWDDIMAEIGYGPAQTYRIHQAAIKAFDRKLKDDSK